MRGMYDVHEHFNNFNKVLLKLFWFYSTVEYYGYFTTYHSNGFAEIACMICIFIQANQTSSTDQLRVR